MIAGNNKRHWSISYSRRRRGYYRRQGNSRRQPRWTAFLAGLTGKGAYCNGSCIHSSCPAGWILVYPGL